MQKLTQLRLAKGMTQEELAKATGVSLRTIQRIELGQVNPRAYSLKQIASALQVDYLELYSPCDPPGRGLSATSGGGRMQQLLYLFYSTWATLLFLLLLLNISTQVLGTRYTSASLLFENDFQIFALGVNCVCIFGLIQIHSLLRRKNQLKAFTYWIWLLLFSMMNMYVACVRDFVCPP